MTMPASAESVPRNASLKWPASVPDRPRRPAATPLITKAKKCTAKAHPLRQRVAMARDGDCRPRAHFRVVEQCREVWSSRTGVGGAAWRVVAGRRGRWLLRRDVSFEAGQLLVAGLWLAGRRCSCAGGHPPSAESRTGCHVAPGWLPAPHHLLLRLLNSRASDHVRGCRHFGALPRPVTATGVSASSQMANGKRILPPLRIGFDRSGMRGHPSWAPSAQ